MDINSLTPHYFEWVVKHMADLAIRLAHRPAPPVERDALGRRCSAASRRPPGASTAVRPAPASHGRDAARAADAIARVPRPAAPTSSPPTRRQQLDDQLRRARPVLRRPAALHRAAAAVPHAARSTAFLQRRVGVVLRAFRTAHDRGARRPDVPAQFRLRDWERAAARASTPASPSPSPTSRLDAFFARTTDGLRFTEYNAETPAGAGVHRRADRRVLRPAGHARVPAAVRRAAAARAARRAARAARRVSRSGRARATRRAIAILDWREVPTLQRVRPLPATTSSARGSSASSSIRATWSTATASSRRAARTIDLIYKRVLISELVERGGHRHPGRARRARRRRLHGEPVPLQDPAQEGEPRGAAATSGTRACSTPRSARRSRRHIPWTRVVEERRTTRRRRATIDLRPVHR